MENPTLELSFHYPELSFHSHRSILALLFWFPANLIPCRLPYLTRADCPHIFLPKSDLSCSTGIQWILSPGLAQGVLASTVYRWLPHELFQSWYHLLHDLENMPKFMFFFFPCVIINSHIVNCVLNLMQGMVKALGIHLVYVSCPERVYSVIGA